MRRDNRDNSGRSALVTGANAGIGLETAAQLAEAGYGTVILVCRTTVKAEGARTHLVQRTGRDPFIPLAADLSEPAAAAAAAAELAARHQVVDLLILNAAMGTGAEKAYNSDGVELTFASTLIGHHVLAVRLLEEGLLAPHARIVIAGSEVARGDTAAGKVPDFADFAGRHFAGDLQQALAAIARFEAPYTADPISFYGTCKVYTAWWAAALARRLPPGMTVNAVSPGSVPSTAFTRHQSFFLRSILYPLVARIGPYVGLAGPVADAAGRYLQAADFDDATTGQFFASPPGKVTGPLQLQKGEQFLDRSLQEAGWQVISQLAGVAYG